MFYMVFLSTSDCGFISLYTPQTVESEPFRGGVRGGANPTRARWQACMLVHRIWKTCLPTFEHLTAMSETECRVYCIAVIVFRSRCLLHNRLDENQRLNSDNCCVTNGNKNIKFLVMCLVRWVFSHLTRPNNKQVRKA